MNMNLNLNKFCFQLTYGGVIDVLTPTSVPDQCRSLLDICSKKKNKLQY